MKVIFLDIDGVLNCHKTPNPRKFPYVIDDGLLARFRQLIERTGASVVLSSTWRYDPAGIFSAKHYGVPFIDITPDMPDEPRCKEILTWIRNHPEVTRYAEGLDKRITQAHRANADSKRLDAIPGFGVILSTAVVATMTDPKSFKTGREFAAWIGLVPRQNSTGGKERLGSISKQGDRYLRRLLVARKSRVIMV